MGPFNMAYDAYPHAEPRPATAYVRPHELEIDRVPSPPASVPGRVVQINPGGAVVKVRVAAEEFGIELSVDLVRERALHLNLQVGEPVFVYPKTVRVFLPEIEYAI